MLMMSTEQPESLLLEGQAYHKPSLPVLSIIYPGDAVTKVGTCHQLTMEGVDTVADMAITGFHTHRRTTGEQRAEILTKLANKLVDHSESLAKLITLECGKPVTLSMLEVQRAVELCRGYANQVTTHENRVVRSGGREATLKYFPIGPVLAITPYNFPLNLVMHKLAPAIAAGCSLTLKPASKTPLTALYVGRLAVECGYTAINVVPCENDVAEALVHHPAFAKVTFTGSSAVGWHLYSQVGQKPMTLELGGNAACIVEDVSEDNVQRCARRIAQGAFGFSGQTCVSVQRVLVNNSIADSFTKALIAEARNLRVGNPLLPETDIGPMITPEDIIRTRELIKETIGEGGNVVYGGNTYNALTMNPTIFDRTTPSMRINREELFAPLMTLTLYDSYEDALTLANASEYGLQAGIYTADWHKAQRAFEVLDVGGVLINDVPTTRLDYLPYGGVKASGFGREGVMTGIAEFSTLKTLVVDPTF